MKSINESINSSYKNDILKKIDIVFCNEKDPIEAMEFMIDVVSALQQGVIDKVKYMSTTEPNLKKWKELEDELKKSTEDYIITIEDVQRSK